MTGIRPGGRAHAAIAYTRLVLGFITIAATVNGGIDLIFTGASNAVVVSLSIGVLAYGAQALLGGLLPRHPVRIDGMPVVERLYADRERRGGA